MSHCWNAVQRAGILFLFVSALSLSSGCATTNPQKSSNLPPVLSLEEVRRPYDRMGVITVQRERFGAPGDLSASDYEWGYTALRQEAAKMGADAVIYPEIRGERESYVVFPTSELIARGVAIKFR